MTQVIRKAILICKALLFTVRTASNFILGISCDRIRAWRASRPLPSNAKSDIPQNIVVIGASFAGYFAASRIARFLPSGDTHRVVVIEPNSHFQFTWVLPRFCVVGGHEHKAFIPYGGLLKGVSSSKIRWIRDCAVSVDQDNVKLRSGNKIPYKYLVIATGSNNNGKLPSRVGSERKEEGEALLREMQSKIKESQNLVVVGGGAAGVELVADAKSRYPDKHITLVHSRAALMHRFGPELQTAALESLQKLGVELVLGERVTSDQPVEGFINTDSGRRLECDMIVSCVGQKPASHIFSILLPHAILPSGHIKVLSTMQVAEDHLHRVYACGDVTETGTRNPNGRSAVFQAQVVARNIIQDVMGSAPCENFTPHWGLEVIKLTLGLGRSITQLGDGQTELLFNTKDVDEALMSAKAWKQLGELAFKDQATEAFKFEYSDR